MKLALGTVQFGLDYGVSNRDGKTSADEVGRILAVARTRGIEILDTAPAYGESEAVIGQSLPDDTAFRIVSKTRTLRIRPSAADYSLTIGAAFEHSLKMLRRQSIYGLLVHHTDDLLEDGSGGLWAAMEALKRNGLVTKIGVSIYTGEQIDQILDRYPIDLIQVPINVLDQRLVRSGHLARLKAKGVEIHARSAFLQGLLLIDPAGLPPYFAPFQGRLRQYRDAINQCGITPVQAALGFVASIPEIDNIICGVNNHRQLQDICDALGVVTPMNFHVFACDDEKLLNPSQWNRTI